MSTDEIRCSSCGARNRVPVTAKGRPRCAKCHSDLPWLGEVGSSDLDAVLSASAVPVLVDLWAPWCGPCRTIAPILEQLVRDRAGSLRVAKVNVDQAPDLSARLGVQGIPTMVLYSGGHEVGRQVGALPAHALASWIDGALAGRGGS